MRMGLMMVWFGGWAIRVSADDWALVWYRSTASKLNVVALRKPRGLIGIPETDDPDQRFGGFIANCKPDDPLEYPDLRLIASSRN